MHTTLFQYALFWSLLYHVQLRDTCGHIFGNIDDLTNRLKPRSLVTQVYRALV